MDLAALNAVATAMVAPGRGILAADESTGTIKKRFDVIGVENIEENRRDYRELLFRSAGGMEHISGVILFEETLYQSAVDGTPFVDLITRAGAIPGIKVDKGASKMAGFPGETITKGLDGLSKRLRKDYEQGARFAKWRAVIDIADGVPTWGAIKSNAHALARYAAICQQEQIVPIVEPEVLMDGAHDIDRCDEVTRWILQTTFQELYEQRVALEGMVLKPNMVVPGKKWQRPVSVQQVAERTIAALKATVPSAVPGIAYLSGGQSDEEATAHLDAMNKIGGFPWKMTFSYGRALQAAPQKAWAGKRENTAAAQAAFAHRARMNGLASLGQWSPDMERQQAA
ncbi:MAG: fructose-bisphosphate aldolase class I [Proteobacteria bacterium]|nr:fructose-bisphosphate aldolase class I [Pseudomonadota bacterium]